MKEILVLGGGFGGVAAVHSILKKVSKDKANITLIDKNSYHLFTPSLYEIATKEETQKNVAIPFSEIFGNRVNVVKGKISKIDIQNHLVSVDSDRNFAYDYLIIALGSEPMFFDIEGLEEFSSPMKRLEDAVNIRKNIQDLYHKGRENKKNVKVVVGGGGFTGTELTAELVNFKERLSMHSNSSLDPLDLTIIQGSTSLLKELDQKVSSLAEKRMNKFNVKVVLNSHITKVTENSIEVDTGEKLDYDFFVWTGGIKANKILAESGLKTDGRGGIEVNDKMQINGMDNVFAVGDNAIFANPKDNRPVPQVAEVAEDQGKVAGTNIAKSINGEELISYNFLHLGYIIPLKGRFAVADLNKIRIAGILGWVLQQFVFLYYLLRIMSFPKAFKRWNRFEIYLNENI